MNKINILDVSVSNVTEYADFVTGSSIDGTDKMLNF